MLNNQEDKSKEGDILALFNVQPKKKPQKNKDNEHLSNLGRYIR